VARTWSKTAGEVLPEGRGEPAIQPGVGDGRHATLANSLDAVVPELCWPEVDGGIAEHQPLDTLWAMEGEPLAHHAAQGKAAEVGAPNAEAVQQVD
jgi:hypothetical protein